MTASSDTSASSSTPLRLTEEMRKRLRSKSYRDFDKIILHHTATRRLPKYDVQWCRDFHVKKRGWQDIGYHFYVEADGTLKEGRDTAVSGAHTKGQNSKAIGIAFVGGIDDYGDPFCTLTADQAQTILYLVDELRSILGKELPLHGHREFSPTFCPGFDVSDPYQWPNVGTPNPK